MRLSPVRRPFGRSQFQRFLRDKMPTVALSLSRMRAIIGGALVADLNLKIEEIEDEGTSITWNDVQKNIAASLIAAMFGIVATGVGVYFIDTSNPSAAFLGAVLAAMFLGWIPALILYLIVAEFTKMPRPRRLDVFPKSIEHEGHAYHLDEVSRVEYGKRRDWDQSGTVEQNDHIQIRVWLEDARFIVVSENNWTTEVNHQLHNAIQGVISRYQSNLKNIAYEEQEQTEEPKPQGFGIPDY